MNLLLTTERLNIKPVTENDIEQIFSLQNSEETARFNTSKPPKEISETETIVRGWIAENDREKVKNYTFKVELIDQNQFIGLIGIKLGREHYKNAEIWFQYDSKFWNKGYATESARKIIAFGFEDLQLHRIEAGCAVGNIGSISVLEKIGMTREAHTRQLLPLPSGWSDNYGYAILSTDSRK